MTKRTRMILLLVVMLMTGVIASVWLQDTIVAQSTEASPPEDVGDLSNATTVEVKDSTGTVVLRGHFVDSPEDDDDVERKATLTGSGTTAKATGEAEIEVSRNNNRLDQEVEVSVSNLAPTALHALRRCETVGNISDERERKGRNGADDCFREVVERNIGRCPRRRTSPPAKAQARDITRAPRRARDDDHRFRHRRFRAHLRFSS